MSDPLIRAALDARTRAHAPYSGFRVGSAVESELGRVFTGCNIENASYGLTLCAERVAIFKAVSEAAGKLVRICVAADTPDLTPPCGACRQIIWEFCGDVPVILVNLKGDQRTLQASELLPLPFDRKKLGTGAASGEKE